MKKMKVKKFLILGPGSAIAKYFIARLRKEDNMVFEVTSYKGKKRVYAENTIKNKINEFKPEAIINFVGTYSSNYSESYSLHVLVPKNLFDAAVKAGYSGKIILIGSAAEYGIQDNYVEDCIEKPKSVYGLTKLMQHSLFQYYASTTQIKANYIRLFNVLHNQINDRLFIGNFSKQVKKVLRKESDEIKLGNLNQYRDYLLINDVYSGFMKVIEKGDIGEVYNLGMGRSILLNKFVQEVLISLKLHPKLITEKISSVGNIKDRVVSDITKIKEIGWVPKFEHGNLINEYCRRLKEEILNEES